MPLAGALPCAAQASLRCPAARQSSLPLPPPPVSMSEIITPSGPRSAATCAGRAVGQGALLGSRVVALKLGRREPARQAQRGTHACSLVQSAEQQLPWSSPEPTASCPCPPCRAGCAGLLHPSWRPAPGTAPAWPAGRRRTQKCPSQADNHRQVWPPPAHESGCASAAESGTHRPTASRRHVP